MKDRAKFNSARIRVYKYIVGLLNVRAMRLLFSPVNNKKKVLPKSLRAAIVGGGWKLRLFGCVCVRNNSTQTARNVIIFYSVR